MLQKNKVRHQELPEGFYQNILTEIISAPDALCENRTDERVRIFYCQKNLVSKCYRAAVLTPRKENFDNYHLSILSVRFSREREYLTDINQRSLWVREEAFDT
jgi:predicted ferric reductase